MPIMRPVNKSAKTKSKEGRLARHLRVAKQLREQPKSIGPLLRESMVSVWRSRGGGFYGLGYIIAFIYFEAQMLAGDVLESDSVADFAVAQVFEFIIRIGFLSDFDMSSDWCISGSVDLEYSVTSFFHLYFR